MKNIEILFDCAVCLLQGSGEVECKQRMGIYHRFLGERKLLRPICFFFVEWRMDMPRGFDEAVTRSVLREAAVKNRLTAASTNHSLRPGIHTSLSE